LRKLKYFIICGSLGNTILNETESISRVKSM